MRVPPLLLPALTLGVTILVGGSLFAWKLKKEIRAQDSTAPTSTAAPVAKAQATVGQPFPDFTLPGIDGGTFTLSRDRDPQRYTVLVFHSPDCPCAANCASLIAEMGTPKYAAAVQVIGILEGKIDEFYLGRAREQLASGAVTFPLYIDADRSLADLVGAERTPTVWVLDKAGRTVFCGAPENTLFPGTESHRYLLREVIDALLAGRPAPLEWHAPLGCPIER